MAMPNTDLHIALIPHSIAECDTQSNLRIVEHRLNELPEGTDLVVLPEMFNSGFIPDRPTLLRLAEPNNGPTLQAVRRWSDRYGFAVWGGFTAREGNKLYNRGFMVAPGREPEFYDKRHLFPSGGEAELLTVGMKEAPIVDYMGWNLKMSLCYDIRFPVWNRSRANEYDVLVIPANWVHSRYFAWSHLLIARAIENQCYVLGCNREGNDVYGQYMRGDSIALNHWGDDIGRLQSDGTVFATLSAEELNRDRAKFAPWRDADDFNLKIN